MIGPACPAVFPVAATCVCQPLPHVLGSPGSEYYGLIRLPKVFGLPTCSFGVAYLGQRCRCPGTHRASQVLNVSLHPCRALCRPRQTLDALTKACAPCWLLRPLTHRRLHYCPNEAVSRLRGVRSPLRPGCYSVYASTLLFGHCAQRLCPCRQARRGAARSPPNAEVFPCRGHSSNRSKFLRQCCNTR